MAALRASAVRMAQAPGEHAHEAVAPRITEHVRHAAAMFADRFGRPPVWAAFAPGRFNLIGDHTDYNQGFVLPIAIERETVIVGDRARGERSTLVAADVNDVWEVDFSGAVTARRGKPGSHVLGVVDQFQHRGHAVPNLDALITSNVPIGAGLASSAALEVAFATLLERVIGVALVPLEKARLCQAAEHAFAGTPCGIMDMYISAAAREGHALLIDCRREEARPVPADFARHGGALLIVDTGVKHELAGSAYAERRETCAQAAAALGRESLRGAAIEDLNIIGLSNMQRRRALHVISENTRTILAAEALALGDLPRLGELMFNSHASLRDLYEVSCPELDAIVEDGAKMRERSEGVVGARMTGGGFGGCAIVLCEATAIDRVMDRVRGAFVERFSRAPAMFTSAAAGGAQVVPDVC